jgi:hypothetical protein
MVAAGRIQDKIKGLDLEIEEAEMYEPQRMSALISAADLKKNHVNELFIKTHLAADFLADCAMQIREVMDKLDLRYCSLFDMLDNIFKESQSFANFVCRTENQKLVDFMCDNEDYINALHGFTSNYINQRINIDEI